MKCDATNVQDIMCHIVTPLNANNASVHLCFRLSGAKNKTEAGRNAGENRFTVWSPGSPQLFVAVSDHPPLTFVSLLLMSEETKPTI